MIYRGERVERKGDRLTGEGEEEETLSKLLLPRYHLSTLVSGYISIGYTVFLAITAIFLLNFWSQNQFHTLKYFGFTGISHLPAILARTNVVDVTGIECTPNVAQT